MAANRSPEGAGLGRAFNPRYWNHFEPRGRTAANKVGWGCHRRFSDRCGSWHWSARNRPVSGRSSWRWVYRPRRKPVGRVGIGGYYSVFGRREALVVARTYNQEAIGKGQSDSFAVGVLSRGSRSIPSRARTCVFAAKGGLSTTRFSVRALEAPFHSGLARTPGWDSHVDPPGAPVVQSLAASGSRGRTPAHHSSRTFLVAHIRTIQVRATSTDDLLYNRIILRRLPWTSDRY